MNILVCCDEPPFPPRNGVTIPCAAYIRLLRAAGHTVDCLVLADVSADAGHEKYLEHTAGEVDSLRVLPRRRSHALARLLGEMVLGRPSFHAWQYPEGMRLPGRSLAEYDVLLATPISALDYPLQQVRSGQRLVAGISDSYTSVLANDLLKRKDSGLGLFMRRLRVWRMAGIESRLLARCDAVIVQTARDHEWIRRIGGEPLALRTLPIANGVPDDLLAAPLPETAPPPVMVFVANFTDPLYRRNLAWFYAEVWPVIRRDVPDARLRIAGKGLEVDVALSAMLANDGQVDVLGFVPELLDVYRHARVVLAPIFKSYGYINKVAEAYAAGLPVVGDHSAFNGLLDSLERGCGMAAGTADEFSRALLSYLQNDLIWRQASRAARAYGLSELAWSSRLPDLTRAVTGETLS